MLAHLAKKPSSKLLRKNKRLPSDPKPDHTRPDTLEVQLNYPDHAIHLTVPKGIRSAALKE